MKHLILFFSILLLNNATVSAQSYSHGRTLMDLKAAEQWLEAEEFYLLHRDNIHEETRLWYIGASGIPLNRQAEAIAAFHTLIERNPWNYCKADLATHFVIPLLHLYADIGEHESVIELAEKWIEVFENEVDSEIELATREWWIQWLREAIRSISRNLNQELIDLMFEGQWFAAKNFYQQYNNYIDETLGLWFWAASATPFNYRQAEAIDTFHKLINNNPLDMCQLALAQHFAFPLLQLYADVGKHEKAIEFSQKWIDFLEKGLDCEINLDARIRFIKGLGRLQHLSENPLTVTRNDTDNIEKVELLPIYDNAIFFYSKWNGIKLRTLFDTGVSEGAFILNRAIAEKIGVNFNESVTSVTGQGTNVITGMVDKLELGEFTLRNIPVMVVIDEIDTTDPYQVECEYILNSMFDIILGMAVMMPLGVIEFDFINNTMSFPQQAEATDKRNLYLHNNVLYINVEICNAPFVAFFDTGAFEGLTINARFFHKHNQCIVTEANEDGGAFQVRAFGGGCSAANIIVSYKYRCPQIDIVINGQVVSLINDTYVAKDEENNHSFALNKDGLLGNHIFNYLRKVRFDFVNMVFSVEPLFNTSAENNETNRCCKC